MTNTQLFIEAMLAEVGAPYVWGGKGTHIFDATHGLVNSPYFNVEKEQDRLKVFDCSGLVTWGLMRAAGKDKRGAWSSSVMADTLENLHGDTEKPHLRYYGKGRNAITHIACAIHRLDGRWLMVEAAGGDSSTRTPLDAMERGAKVRVGFERRLDLQTMTVLPL